MKIPPPAAGDGLTAAAVAYARRGYAVIPVRHVDADGVCSCMKAHQCPSPGKHPVHSGWTSGPVPSPEDIAHEWAKRPQSNIGLRTGTPSGFFVLDIDPDHGGADSFTRLLAAHGELPPTYTVTTGSGGTHLYFLMPPAPQDITNASKMLKAAFPGIDVRGTGGQVVAPPSVSTKGPYSVLDDLPVAPAPPWLLDLLTAPAAPAHPGPAPVPAPAPAPPKRAVIVPGTGGSRYGIAALSGELAAVAAAPPGTRNDRLNRAAFVLGQLVAGGELEHATVVTALADAATGIGLTPAEAAATTASGMKAGAAIPRTAPRYFAHPRSDIGNSDRLRDTFGADMRYAPARGWFIWDGWRWRPDSTLRATQLAKETMKRMLEMAGEFENTDDRETWTKFALRSQSRGALTAAEELLRPEPGIVLEADRLDADPYRLLARNGTIDLTTGALLPVDRGDLITKGSPVDYDPTGHHPRFSEWLTWFTQGNTEVQDYLQLLVGATLIGSNSVQVLPFLHGGGENGKSTFIKIISALLGDYAMPAPPDLLVSKPAAGGHTADLATLAGARFVVVSETSEHHLNESLVKDMTGEPNLTASFKGKNPFTFPITFTIWMHGNYRPVIRGSDHGIWRRIKLVSTYARVADDKKQEGFENLLLEAEGPAILAWAVKGAVRVSKDRKIIDPEVISGYVQNYRSEQDEVGAFLMEHYEMDNLATSGVHLSELWHTYDMWRGLEGGADFARTKSALKRAVLMWADARQLDNVIAPVNAFRVNGKLAKGLRGMRETGATAPASTG